MIITLTLSKLLHQYTIHSPDYWVVPSHSLSLISLHSLSFEQPVGRDPGLTYQHFNLIQGRQDSINNKTIRQHITLTLLLYSHLSPYSILPSYSSILLSSTMHSSSLIPVVALLSSLVAASPSLVVPGALTNSNDILSPRNNHELQLLNHKRRHHAKMADLERRNLSPRALLSLTGFGTLYYDINGGGTCGPANGWSSFPETSRPAMCEPWQATKTLAQRGTNKIVALPVSMMSGNLDKYCGKEVTATYNGKTISGLIAWDGCAACDSGVSNIHIFFQRLLIVQSY